MQALQTLSTQLGAVSDEFIESLHELSRSIAATAKPMSSTSSSFVAHSSSAHPAMVSVPSGSLIPFAHKRDGKSDLYQWRDIFQLYVDMEVFESHSEKTRGERSVEDAEERLESFKQRLLESGYMDSGKTLRLKESREALEKFMRLNTFILDLKKVSSFYIRADTRSMTVPLSAARPVPICYDGSYAQDSQKTRETHCALGGSLFILAVHYPQSHDGPILSFLRCDSLIPYRHLALTYARPSTWRDASPDYTPY